MTKNIKLKAVTRQAKEKLNKLMMPAVVYGRQIENRLIAVNKIDFEKVYQATGESSLIDLSIDDGQPLAVMIKDIQLDPIKHQPIHLDFYQVDMERPVNAEVELQFVGQAPAVEELGGVLVKHLTHLEIFCLPKNLVHYLEVDISGLKNFDDAIYVKDIKMPTGIEVKRSADDMVVSVIEPRQQVEESAHTTNEAQVVDKAEVKAESDKSE